VARVLCTVTRIVVVRSITGSRHASSQAHGIGGIPVLHADDRKGGWCGFAGAGNTSSVRNLNVDKVGAAESLTGATMVIKRIKRSRHEEVEGGQPNGLSINQRGT